MATEAVQKQFTIALDALLEEIRKDRAVLAAVLCGSLSYDTVWSRSDIDLVLVTIDDKLVKAGCQALHADGVNVHAMLIPRGELRKLVDGSIHNSFMHAFLARGRILYTHDETIADLLSKLNEIGERDTQLQLLRAANEALPAIYKAHKWLITRGDLDYTALWMLYAATALARMEVIAARQVADREVIPQALKLNPGFFRIIYVDLLNARKTRRQVEEALAAVDAYLASRAPRVFALVFEHLRETGEARSCTEIEDHFIRNYDLSGVTTACEYLADQGLIGKAALPVRLTKKSTIEVQELAFFPLDERMPGRARGR